jgi:ribosome recycling factor
MLDDIFQELHQQYDEVIKALQRDLLKVRTGRANPTIFDNLRVDYYGTPTPINQVGAIKVVDANLLTIQPWEKNMIPVIEKAILTSDLGLNPANDGVLIRVPIPPLTGERRQQLVKAVKKYGEDRRIAARGFRRDANDLIKALEKDSEISEDEMHRALKSIQDDTDKVMARIDALLEAKEKEVLDG